MKRRWLNAAVTLLALAGLSLSLRHDLANLAQQRGDERLQAGDVKGAEAAFRHAVALGGDAAPLAYNLGVSLYRKGEFAKAQKQFAVALVTAGPELAVAIHYNRGNCQFRQGERLAASDQQAAARLFQDAVADYGKALALAPGAADAGNNLNLARTRLAALGDGQTRGPAHDARTRKAGAEQPRTPASSTGNSPQAGARQASTQLVPRQQKASASTATKSDHAEASATSGKPRRDLSQTEAERLLNEARGRENLAGMPHGGNQHGPLPKPDKDW